MKSAINVLSYSLSLSLPLPLPLTHPVPPICNWFKPLPLPLSSSLSVYIPVSLYLSLSLPPSPSHHRLLSQVVPLQHTATHCNTPQHTTAHCNTLQQPKTHRSTRQNTLAADCSAYWACALRMSKGGLPLVMTKEIIWISDFFFFHTNDVTARAPYLSESELKVSFWAGPTLLASPGLRRSIK